MGQGPQGQADGSPVGWVSTNLPSLTVPPFSSSSFVLQYSSAPFSPLCVCLRVCVREYICVLI